MNRAIVIYGDKEIGNAVADGMVRVLPLDSGEMKVVLAENKRLNALNGVRSYGDSVRWQTVADALAVKYQQKPHGRLYGAILGAWACLWMGLMGWVEYFQEWNRG